MNFFVTFLAKCNSVIRIKPERRKLCPRLDMMRIQPAAALMAVLACVIVALVHRTAPIEILNSSHVPLSLISVNSAFPVPIFIATHLWSRTAAPECGDLFRLRSDDLLIYPGNIHRLTNGIGISILPFPSATISTETVRGIGKLFVAVLTFTASGTSLSTSTSRFKFTQTPIAFLGKALRHSLFELCTHGSKLYREFMGESSTEVVA